MTFEHHTRADTAAGLPCASPGTDGPAHGTEEAQRDALLLANVRDSVIVVDLEGMVTYWNAGATRVFGWTAEEMVGRPMADRFPSEVRASVEALTRSILEGTEWSGEFEDYHKDGSRIWIDARVGCIADSSGKTVGVMGISHDISRRKRAELDRDRIEAQLRSHIERMPLAYVLLDADFRITGWNPAAERTFGYTKEEALGMRPPFTRLIPTLDWEERLDGFEPGRAGDIAAHSINDNCTKDGRIITCEWYNTTRFAEDGSFMGLVALAQDITERKRSDEARRKSGSARLPKASARCSG
jgi:two-component system cell cycle sensor histidine kinase/response regulator CckA